MKSLLAAALAMLSVSLVNAAPPNILFMLSDDQAWSGLSCQMHPDMPDSKSSIVQTPNIARLAEQGMRFSAAYAPAPVCSPTRISLQTGRNPAALGWTKAAPAEPGHRLIEGDNRKSIRDDEVTIGQMLKSAGYATAHYGKWHLVRRWTRRPRLRRERWRHGQSGRRAASAAEPGGHLWHGHASGRIS
jgi:arylsulfatase A